MSRSGGFHRQYLTIINNLDEAAPPQPITHINLKFASNPQM